MPPQDPVRAFTPEVRLAFEAYLNEVSKSGKALMNATKRAQYLHFLANPEQKIIEKDKVKRARLHSEKRRAIKEFCVYSRGQLLHVAQKKEISPSLKPLFMTRLITSSGYMLREDIMDTRRRFSG